LIEQAKSRPDWALGFADEVWFSRLAQPSLCAWSLPGEPARLYQKEPDKGDTGGKALACYGLYLPESPPAERMLLRFAGGRPVSALTCPFLEWVCERLRASGKRVLLLFWDNASWHISRQVRRWIRQHNRRAKEEGGLRLLAVRLPTRSPWLNAIEAKWVHGKRAVTEPRRVLSPDELTDRLCRYYQCQKMEALS